MNLRIAFALAGMFVSGVLLSGHVIRLYRRVFKLPEPTKNETGNCLVHDWANWSAPQSVEVKTVYPGHYSSPETVRDGLFQDRFCTRCNLYERRVT